MSEGNGNRPAQIIGGAIAGCVGAFLLIGHFIAAGHPPRDLELYIGAGLVVVGLWLAVPVGMGRIGEQARKLWHEFRGHE